MRFSEPRIASTNYLDPEDVYALVVRDLCGEKYHRPFRQQDKRHIADFLKLASEQGFTFERFNELLLLLEQDRVSEAFYTFFFSSSGQFPLNELADKVIRFRGFAMLCYGNFRFAYKDLSRKTKDELLGALKPFCQLSRDCDRRLAARPAGALRLESIPADQTWAVGKITKMKYDKEAKVLAELLKADPRNRELGKLSRLYERLGQELEETRGKALRNTDVYLTWDYMDIYVATSMRKRWEFSDVASFVIELFADRRLCDLNLRYFDPTQSDCSSRIDKGLVEALMLKRALCTVYMVQESDTLGKDSELASTLAQGKPVVAFVPAVDVVSHAEKITTYPLEYFRVRFRVLDAEGVFDDPDLRSELHKLDAKFAETLTEFLRRVDDFAGREPLTLCGGREANFKKKLPGFGLVCKILATAEQHNFERRAKILRNLHPLSLQVHLESGVANGVLVVRSVQECAEVVHGLLTNRLEFAIENDEDQNCTILREKVSKSPFRVVSNYEKLSNSFWNFYPFSG